MRKSLFVLALLLTVSAWASGTRILDGAQITNGAATVTIPTSTTTLVGRDTTDTLTNKTLTAPAISSPTGIVKGDVGLGNVDNTSDATKNSATATLTNKTIDASLNTLSNVTASSFSGTLPKANGGTAQDNSSLTFPSSGTVPAITPTNHGVVISGSGAAASVTSAGTATFVLTSNGASADPTFQAVPSTAPSLNGSTGTPQAVTAAGGVSLSSLAYVNFAFITGSPGAVTVTATPSITQCTAVGQQLYVVSQSATNTVRLNDEATTAGSKLQLNGPWVGGLNSQLHLTCDGTYWVEAARR